VFDNYRMFDEPSGTTAQRKSEKESALKAKSYAQKPKIILCSSPEEKNLLPN